MPQYDGRRHVPELQGDGRGAALDARTGAAAVGDDQRGRCAKEGFQSEAVHQALDLCLSCKACKSECPVQVDVAAWKSEFLAQHYKGRMHPLHHYIFGFADKLARWGALTPALTNAVLTGPITSPLVKYIVGRRAGTEAAAAGSKKLSAVKTRGGACCL
jgi:Fe-S oxidoreductase